MQKTRENERRDSGIIFILILLLGFICIILASGWALRFAPSWKLNTSMGSNLDPNSDFLTSRPVGFIDPLDPAILTNPAWINIFLTPGASLPKRTPLPASTATNIPPNTNTPIPIPTLVPPATNTLVVFIPPPPPTRTKVPPPPPPPPTAVPPTAVPPPAADLGITKSDSATDYVAGASVQYTITVTNAGPADATGASVADTIPASITGVMISCATNGTASCGTNASAGNNLSYTGVNITAGAGNNVMITVSGTINPATTGALANTATVTAGAETDPTPANNTATDTDQQIVASSFPNGNIGSAKDGFTDTIPSGTYVTLQFSSPLVVNGTHAGYDLVYYELPQGTNPGIFMDAVIIIGIQSLIGVMVPRMQTQILRFHF